MKALVALFAIVVVLFLIIFGPIATIWALNTLFPALVIPYTFESWLAIIVLGTALRANVTVKSKG